MATLTTGPGAVDGIDYTKYDIKEATNDDAGSSFVGTPPNVTAITFSADADSFDTYRGKFVITAAGSQVDEVISGTINEWEAFDDNKSSSLLAGLSMSVAQFEGFLNANNSLGFLASSFAGNDTMTLSDKADNMLGFAGNDTIDGKGGDDTLSGAAGNDSLIGGTGDDSLDGGAGNDSYNVDSSLDKAEETGKGAAGGTDTVFSSAAAYTLGANIENLTLASGAIDLDGTGNTLANVITGNDGANELAGDAGNDKLVGGKGNDSLAGGADNDTLDGGDGDDSLDGGTGNDSLLGGDGEDTLVGSTGNDSLAGGAGNDVYFVDVAGDKVTETLTNLAGGGIDLVNSNASFTLGLNVDNLLLIDGAGDINGTGNADKNEITGNDGANKLSGLAGDDTILGGGGKDLLDGGIGADSLDGGEDDDIYIQDNKDDKIDDSGTTLDDELRTNQETLGGAIADIEHYTFTGTKAVTFTGSDAANRIVANAAADTLAGGKGDDTLNGLGGSDLLQGDDGNDSLDGGTGSDSMAGGKGDDTYVVDNAMDKIDDTEGTDDTVRALVSVNLQTSFAGVDHVILTGAAAINATGSDDVGNELTGNDGANKLDGGTGNDSMDGGKGADIYFVDVSTDKVSETVANDKGGGIDTVIVDKAATGTFVLGANIDNLTLQGANDVNATGNDLANVITGNDGKNLIDGGKGIDKMAGGLGNDIYVVDDSKDTVTETAPGGLDLVRSSATFTLGANVENLELTGSGNKDGTGNTLDNDLSGNDGDNKLLGLGGKDELTGGLGNDTLDGGLGDDSLTGGKGNDTYLLDSVNDEFSEAGGDGIDTVSATFKIDLNNAFYDDIENATLLGTAVEAIGDDGANILTGNASGNKLSGNGASDSLVGGGGNDTLDGGEGEDSLDGGTGSDSMQGGKGSDVFFVDSAADKLGDSGDASDKDQIRTSITYSLATLGFIENAMLLGVAAINLTGNTLANVLVGNDGNNKLDGGAEADTLQGGLGLDTLTGGAEADTLQGGLGLDTLTGGAGLDNLQGGTGNDLYIVDADDVISEASGEGTDTVQSALTYSLAPWAEVENLVLTGAAAIDGTGNAGKNVITGNAAKNMLDGGAGADTLVGGAGDDSYVVDDSGDKITELAGGGTDTVFSSALKFTLPDNVEHLTLSGSGDIEGTGNVLPNKLTGNDGKNVLSGLAGNDTMDGGAGTDTLNGGLGTDTYLYSGKSGADVVNTGDNGLDRVSLDGSPFDWDVKRDGNDLLIQFVVDEAAADADFDPTHAIRIVNQYAGAAIASFTGDFGEEFNLFYGGNPNLTTVFTPAGVTGKDQGTNAEVVEGTNGADTINGGGGQTDFLYGNDGHDRINSQSDVTEFAALYGGIGNDTLVGAAGTDNLRGDEGNDSMDGGTGRDRVDYRASTDAVLVDLTKQGASQHVSDSQGDDIFTNIENARGGSFNDTLIGNGDSNSLSGRDGADSLVGGGGADFLFGSKGNDTLEGKSLDDFVEVSYEDAKVGAIVNLTNVTHAGVAAHTAQDGLGGIDLLVNIAGVFGSDFGDQIFGADNDEFFEPMGGDDTIDGAGGFDEIDFFSATDAVTASLLLQGQAQLLSATQGKDTYTNFEGLDGGAFNDTLTGDAAGNFLQGRDGNDSLSGGAGDDNLRGGAGNDTVDGGGGFDRADYFQATSGVHVDLTHQNTLQVIGGGQGSDLLLDITDVRGGAFNDTLIGDNSGNTLSGLAGNDSLSSGGGFDFLIGGAGNDTLRGILDDFVEASYGDASTGVVVNLSSIAHLGVAATRALDGSGGTDMLIAIQGVFGSDFNDTIFGSANDEFFEGQGGSDSIDGGGGTGFDEIEFFNSTDAVNVSLALQGMSQSISASQGSDIYVGIEGLDGSSFNDTLTGDGFNNFIQGRAGNDSIDGGFGNDFLRGGAGNDTIVGGGGFDLADYSAAGEGVTVNLNLTTQLISVGQGTDTLLQISDIQGSFFNDLLTGSTGHNAIFGLDGNDTLVSDASSNDRLFGDAGNDRMLIENPAVFFIADGGDGIDTLVIGGAGVTLTQSEIFDSLFNTERIDLTGTGNNSVFLTALDVLQTSNTFEMIVFGNSGDHVTSQGQGWVFSGPRTVDGQLCDVYTTNIAGPTATLVVDHDITQSIS